MHIHTAPDVSQRKCGDAELGQRLTNAGMAGCLIKCHFAETAARAQLLHERFLNLNARGGVVLNRSVGGLNPDAVERCAQMGGRFVWFPTLEAFEYQKFHHHDDPDADLSKYLHVCDPDGKLLPAAYAVLEVAAAHGMIVGTGHISAAEGLEVVRSAQTLGARVVLTHADNPADFYTTEQQVEAVKLGALVEHSYFTTYHKRTPIEVVAKQIRAVGTENAYLSTDFGQLNSPYSDEGLSEYLDLLAGQGFTTEQLRSMAAELPAELLA